MNYNYSTYAIEDFLKWAERYEQIESPKTASMYVELCRMLEQAVKFALPDGGRLFDAKNPLSRYDSDLLHLPYPIVALEYFVSECPNHDEVQNHDAPKRICLAVDWPGPMRCDQGGIQVIPLWFDASQEMWVASSSCAFIPRDQVTPPESLMYVNYPGSQQGDLEWELVQLLDEEYEYGVQELGKDEMRRRGVLDVVDELNSLLSFLLALSCSNVKVRDTEDLSKLNKKRLKRGKRPFFTYKVLDILVPAARVPKGEVPKAQSGRQPPRIHLRRGHVRRLASGSRTWVNACVVGKKEDGIVGKDYRVIPVE